MLLCALNYMQYLPHFCSICTEMSFLFPSIVHIYFVICVTVYCYPGCGSCTELYQMCFLPAVKLFYQSNHIWTSKPPHAYLPATTCRMGTLFAYEWLLTSVSIVLSLFISHSRKCTCRRDIIGHSRSITLTHIYNSAL